jgi:hypothetical protein
VKAQAEDRGVPFEVSVRGEHGEMSASSDGAKEEVDAGTLNALGATEIGECRGLLVVGSLERNVRKRAKAVAERLGLGRRSNAREELLSHWADDESASVSDKVGEGRDVRC